MSTVNDVRAKKYAADLKSIGEKSPRLAAAVTALHEGVKLDEKYAMMDRLVAGLKGNSKEEIEAKAERIEKSVAERDAPRKQYEVAADGSGRSVTLEENLAIVKDIWENRNNR